MRRMNAPGSGHPRAILALLASMTVLLLAACGGSSSGPASSSSSAPSSHATSGRQVFTSAGCVACHTLAAAHASGTTGPDLDRLKPSYGRVVAQVTHGGGGMPSFSGSLSKAQISAVARFVASATR